MKDIALIVGRAPCVHDDLEQARAEIEDFDVIACNQAYQFLEHYDYMASVHAEEEAFKTGFFADVDKTKVLHPLNTGIPNIGGTTGLFAVQCADMLGYKLAVLCGVPLEGPRCIFHEEKGFDFVDKSYEDKTVKRVWHDIAPLLSCDIVSYSGYTKNKFGTYNG